MEVTTLTNRQYCIVQDPVDESKRPRLGVQERWEWATFTMSWAYRCARALGFADWPRFIENTATPTVAHSPTHAARPMQYRSLTSASARGQRTEGLSASGSSTGG